MQSSFPLLPESASTLAPHVDALWWTWIAISAFFSLLIAVAIFYFFVKFRRQNPGDIGQRDPGSMKLEIAWSVIPLAITLVMFAWGTKVYFELSRPPGDAIEYYATGKQWMWKVQHPSGKREINNLHVPVGQPIRLTMISEDVIHSFYVPAFRVKADVLPGRYSSIWFEATKVGKYHLFCAEYCGTEHSKMGGWVTVMEPEDYEAWLSGGEGTQTPTESGEALFSALACNTCHAAGARQRGPDLTGVYGSQVALEGGGTVLADEGYLRESILQPGAKIVAGYKPLMPTYQGQVSEEQLLQLIQYIESLGGEAGGGSPAPSPSATTGGAGS